ncbi:uncharacterized protein LOC105924050 isoform X1 [Fundulus heteroclitus]|uniref:uncharacterized protein LOC105924050 isoform X1 n=2 Tax=Fundulus heteroclitus TaxID=8078 RepID=UPI00165CD14A|nr:uncharacterized protein LOC105924050 isoform X1 [Fundulus heteroclitus]
MADSKEEELRKAAIDLVAMLRSSINGPAPNTQGETTVSPTTSARDTRQDLQNLPRHNSACAPAQASSGIAMQRNMARSFPGLFKEKQSSRALLSKKRFAPKRTAVSFFLLKTACERTPKPSEEMTLLQAGLGRRTVDIAADASHKEITDILCVAYPKMATLEGAWMLYKAIGGSGQRKLNLLSPEEEGYTGASLVRTWAGKGCLYIMPIQHTLDTSPLPFTAPEFQAMPKARCLTCKEYVPLQLLSIHVKTCVSKISGETEHGDDDDVISVHSDNAESFAEVPASIESEASPRVMPFNDLERKVSCPLCSELFTEDDICTHASVCGEGMPNEEYISTRHTTKHFSSLSALLQSLQDKIDTTQTFNVNVTRKDLFQRGLKQWARQKQASPKNVISVSFIGEHGIDQGALRKEFFTEMIRGIEMRLFDGDGEKGKTPKYSLCDYKEDHFKTCGEIFAASIAQGGAAPNFISRWCYQYLCHGEFNKDTIPDEVSDTDLKSLIEEVERAEADELIGLADQVVACGYTGPITVVHKQTITQAINLHAKLRLVPILSQLREGLRLYGLNEVLKYHEDLCEQLFVPGHLKKVDADFLVLALSPNFSEEGSVRREREMQVINFLQDFLQNLEDKEDCTEEEKIQNEQEDEPGTTGREQSVRAFLQWATGQAHVPLIESEKEAFKIIINFDHDCESRYGPHRQCYPTVNACAVALTFPTRHFVTYHDFENLLTEAIRGGFEFSMY